jgi:hypothetical protein
LITFPYIPRANREPRLTPFHLDFARNRIWHFNHDWFIAPWSLHVRNAEELREELVVRNVDYILWQYRSDFAPSLSFLRPQLQGVQWFEYPIVRQNTSNLVLALPKNSFETVYADGSTILISLRHLLRRVRHLKKTDHVPRPIER